MLTLLLFINLNVFPPFLSFIVQFIRCKTYSFFIKNLPKIKILFKIKKPMNKIQLTHFSIKEWNFLVVRSASLNILNIVVVRWFPSKKSSNLLPDFTYNLLNFFKNCWFSSWVSLRNSNLVRTVLSMSLLWWSLSHWLAIRTG